MNLAVEIEYLQRCEEARKRFQKAVSLGCPRCKVRPSVYEVGNMLGLEQSGLWKFYCGRYKTMEEGRLKKLERWLEGVEGKR